jgi:hypothetical protein
MFVASPSTCEERASEVLELTRRYSGDVRSVRQACGEGVECEPEVVSTMASFGSLSNGHAGLIFACTPASAEMCDAVDNDKDGAIDEDFDTGSLCGAGIGACFRGGFKICSADGSGTVCTAQPGTPVAEICDDQDNDCDAETDEGFNGKGESCVVGVGACMRAGFKMCSADGVGLSCTAQAGAPGAEICGDGVDNDCDGATDEGCNSP